MEAVWIRGDGVTYDRGGRVADREENFVEVRGGGSVAPRFLPQRAVMAHNRRWGSGRDSNVNRKPCVPGANG